MPRATWNGALLVESADTVYLEGNHYFPAQAVTEGVLQPSDHTSVCFWKGTASYFHVVVDGEVNENAAWTYRSPKVAAQAITGRVAFWKGVEVTP